MSLHIKDNTQQLSHMQYLQDVHLSSRNAPKEPEYLQPERELQTILWYCHSKHKIQTLTDLWPLSQPIAGCSPACGQPYLWHHQTTASYPLSEGLEIGIPEPSNISAFLTWYSVCSSKTDKSGLSSTCLCFSSDTGKGHTKGYDAMVWGDSTHSWLLVIRLFPWQK